MTIAQLREEVGFAAGIPDIDALGGWFDNELRSILDEYTSLTKYDDLYVQDYSVPLVVGSQNVFNLPLTLQHLDEANIRYYKGGDLNTINYLEKGGFAGFNSGPPNYFIRGINVLATGPVLKIYPYAETSDTDILYINYWSTFPISSDSTIIIPGLLGPVVRHELISRANGFIGDGKKFAMGSEAANKSFIRGMGSVPLQSQNQ